METTFLAVSLKLPLRLIRVISLVALLVCVCERVSE